MSFSPSLTSIFDGHARYRLQSVVHAEFLSPAFEFGLELLEIFAGAALQFARGFIVESLNAGEFPRIDQRQFFDRGKTFRRQQLADDLVDVERFHEHASGILEVRLASLRFLLLGQDVDIPAGQLRGEPHVLSAPPDRERQLVVGIGDHNLDPLPIFVDHDFRDLRRRQRVDDERSDIGRPRDDVDLFALQLVDDRLNARPAHSDASPNRID